jgi:alkylhydroperoxidase family enzyme
LLVKEMLMLRYPVLFSLLLLVPAGRPAQAEAPPRLPMLENDVAWKRLPGAPDAAQPLPHWARILAGPMPLTTARMLELDALHRTGDRLDARLRCLTRWAAADANGCAYSKAVAAADLHRCGCSLDDLPTLVTAPERLPELERAAMAFARKMMRQTHAVTDAEVKHLVDLAGEERVVALVALLAHATFQDRLLLALRAPTEPEGGVPPVTVQFARPQPKEAPPGGAPPGATPKPVSDKEGPPPSPEWLGLREKLDKQRARAGRIQAPSPDRVLKRLGEKHPAAWQTAIVWSRVCYGYQPELTDAWFECTGAFRRESNLDPLVQTSIFWVVTESIECFY